MAAWIVLVLAVGLLLIVPVLIVGLIAVGAAAAWIGLRVLASRLRPSGRRNVRIVDRP